MTAHCPVDLMSTAAYIVRSFNDRSQPDRLVEGCLAVSDAYRTMDSAALLAEGMRQAMIHMLGALQRSSVAFDVYDRGLHPEDVAIAVGH